MAVLATMPRAFVVSMLGALSANFVGLLTPPMFGHASWSWNSGGSGGVATVAPVTAAPVTAAPTTVATQAPTTAAPTTTVATQAPTIAATEAPITAAPTTTQAPTQPAATIAATEAPTTAATQAPTQPPTEISNVREAQVQAAAEATIAYANTEDPAMTPAAAQAPYVVKVNSAASSYTDPPPEAQGASVARPICSSLGVTLLLRVFIFYSASA